MEIFWPGFFQAKYLKLMHLLQVWPENFQAKPVIFQFFWQVV
jgi:hypothetical protein